MNLDKVHAGEETFDAFSRRTSKEWRALAGYICRRVAPSALEHLDDVVQELLVECWLHLPRWDASRGVPLDRFCIFSATSVVTRRLRGKKGDPLSFFHLKRRRVVANYDRIFSNQEASIGAILLAEKALSGAFVQSEKKRAIVLDATRAVLEEEEKGEAVASLRAKGVGVNRARRACREARRCLREAYAA